MRRILVQENNSEVFVFIDRQVDSRLEAMQEAVRLLTMEIMRYESNINGDFNR